MTTTDYIATAIIAISTAACCVALLWSARRDLRAKAGSCRVEGVRISPWRALPGGHLELGATGVRIEYRPSHPEADYLLFHPSGRLLGKATAGYLEVMKRHGEEIAAELAQFEAVQPFPAVLKGVNRD